MLTSVCLSFLACKAFMLSVKSSSAVLSVDEIFSLAKCGCIGLATFVATSDHGSARDREEADSNTLLFTSVIASLIME